MIIVYIALIALFCWSYCGYLIEEGYVREWKTFYKDPFLGLMMLSAAVMGVNGLITIIGWILTGAGWLIGA